MTQTVMSLPTTIQKTWVRSLGQEDPLEKGMATYSSILAWRIPWMEKVSESDMTVSHTHSLTHFLQTGSARKISGSRNIVLKEEGPESGAPTLTPCFSALWR